jgi:predicted double-glycine peptidase
MGHGSGPGRRVVAAACLLVCFGVVAGIHLLPLAIGRARLHSDGLKSARAWMRGARFVRGARTVLQERGNDCGAACLKGILEMRGIRRSLSELRAAAGTTASGASMQGLRRVAESCGVPARSWLIRAGDLPRLPLPAIAFVYDDHFVVVRRFVGPGVLEVDDPALGRLEWPCSAFCRIWAGRVIVFDRDWSPS